MANIDAEIYDFTFAEYGEEVRDSLISLANKLNTELESGIQTINSAEQRISTTITSVNTARSHISELEQSIATLSNTTTTTLDGINDIKSNEAARVSLYNQINALNIPAAEASRVLAENRRVALYNQIDSLNIPEAEASRVSGYSAMSTDVGNKIGELEAALGQVQSVSENISLLINHLNSAVDTAVPMATSSTLGTIKIGNGLSIDDNGTVDVTNYINLLTKTSADNLYVDKTTYSSDKTSIASTYVNKNTLHSGVFISVDGSYRLNSTITWETLENGHN